MCLRKRYRLFLYLIVICSVLTACGKSDRSDVNSEGQQDGRTVLTLANYDSNELDSVIKDYVQKFNDTNAEYRIEIRDYAESEDPVTAFNLDIAAGKYPDIIITFRNKLDRLIHLGLLKDLQIYLDEDPVLNQDDFLDNIMSAWTDNGNLYYMGMNYYITTLFGKSSNLGAYQNGWTKEEMLAYANRVKVPLFYDNDKIRIFDQFFVNGYSEFVDWDNGKANFDKDVFQQILQYSDQGVKNSDRYNVDEAAITDFMNDKCMLASASINTFCDIEEMTRVYGSDLVCVGFPNEYRENSCLHFQNCIGIISKSEYPQAAWQFIQSMFTKEAQYEMVHGEFLSVRKDVFSMLKKAATTKEAYEDEFGNKVSPIEGESPTCNYTPLSQEEADLVEQLVKGANHCDMVDSKIDSIVYEEVSAYFNGDCTIDRVGETINSRVETYMNENR